MQLNDLSDERAQEMRADLTRAHENYDATRDNPQSTGKEIKTALREYGYFKMVYEREAGGSDSEESKYDPDAAVGDDAGGGAAGGDDDGDDMYRPE